MVVDANIREALQREQFTLGADLVRGQRGSLFAADFPLRCRSLPGAIASEGRTIIVSACEPRLNEGGRFDGAVLDWAIVDPEDSRFELAWAIATERRRCPLVT